jgi:Zn-dependent metalloprotease
MHDPTRTGDPDHMDDYLHTTRDSGGVHTNSNIHNKAAYNVLTATGPGGGRIFSSRDVATLYYLCLTRLPRLASFADVRSTLLTVASTLWAGDEAERARKVAAIDQAYAAVGIG